MKIGYIIDGRPLSVRLTEGDGQGASDTFPVPVNCRDCGTPFPFSPALGPDLTPERRQAIVGWTVQFSTSDLIDVDGEVSGSKMVEALEYMLCPDCQRAKDDDAGGS